MIKKAGAGSYTLSQGDSFRLKIGCSGTGFLADGAISSKGITFSETESEVTLDADFIATTPTIFLGTIRVIYTEGSSSTAGYTLTVLDADGNLVDTLESFLPTGSTLPRKAKFGLRFTKV